MTTTATLGQIDVDDLEAGFSVSIRTLRSSDLADALLGEFDRLGFGPAMERDPLTFQLQRLACFSTQTIEDLPDDLAETAGETIENAIDTLNDHAPDGWHLGFSEGDGSDLCWQPVSLRAQLQAVGSRWVADDWDKRSQNDAIDDIIERFDDCPESLQDFDHSDWVNLAECYTRDLLRRWDQQESDIRELFDDYCEAIGCTSALEALEGQTIEDPDDMAAAYVNLAMTWGARLLLDEINPDR
ncbi:hypothetical protein FPZ61_09155 [Synechococcus sp. BSA11S]|uniref:hypothetical protein n=1 Tax=Synechococcales TaxID=1890424 RepID=UPI0016252EC3|nr:hypothetical protein [Synechococcus sp. BSA11S]MBC1264324.1 hypothetical protein [Synechococcus sp. BSA11S]